MRRQAALIRDLIVGVATGTLSALTIVGRAASASEHGWLALDVTVAVVATALVPFLLRRPVQGALALAFLSALSPAATPQASLGVLYVALKRRFPIALAVAATGIAAQVVQGAWRLPGGLNFGWWFLLIVAAYAALTGWGALYRAHRALTDSLRERAERAEADQARRVTEARTLERTRIAREMHDVLAHRLSLLATYAGAVEYRPDSPPDRLTAAARVVREEAGAALDDLRTVIGLLRADSPDDPRPQPTLADIPELLNESRAAGVHIELVDRVREPDTAPAVLGRTAYRVVQEALTNARRHAPGRPVTVELTGAAGGELGIEVRNPLPDVAPTAPPGTGLIGLTERANLAGGQLTVERAGGEFRLRVCLPWTV
jgi:signal transduction histidine kinase